MAPFSVMHPLGLDECGKRSFGEWIFNGKRYYDLACANDSGVPFADIANALREYAKEMAADQG